MINNPDNTLFIQKANTLLNEILLLFFKTKISRLREVISDSFLFRDNHMSDHSVSSMRLVSSVDIDGTPYSAILTQAYLAVNTLNNDETTSSENFCSCIALLMMKTHNAHRIFYSDIYCAAHMIMSYRNNIDLPKEVSALFDVSYPSFVDADCFRNSHRDGPYQIIITNDDRCDYQIDCGEKVSKLEELNKLFMLCTKNHEYQKFICTCDQFLSRWYNEDAFESRRFLIVALICDYFDSEIKTPWNIELTKSIIKNIFQCRELLNSCSIIDSTRKMHDLLCGVCTVIERAILFANSQELKLKKHNHNEIANFLINLYKIFPEDVIRQLLLREYVEKYTDTDADTDNGVLSPELIQYLKNDFCKHGRGSSREAAKELNPSNDSRIIFGDIRAKSEVYKYIKVEISLNLRAHVNCEVGVSLLDRHKEPIKLGDDNVCEYKEVLSSQADGDSTLLSILFFNVSNAASITVNLNDVDKNIPLNTVKTIRELDELINNLDSTTGAIHTTPNLYDNEKAGILEWMGDFNPKWIYVGAAFLISLFLFIIFGSSADKKPDESDLTPTLSETTPSDQAVDVAPSNTPIIVDTIIGIVDNANSSTNIRSEPSSSGSIIGAALTGETFVVLDSESYSDWCLIDYHGVPAYISKTFFTVNS